MGNTSESKPAKNICMGLLAHVDAGKTTLAEGLLYTGGSIRKLGRVDHKDAFLDTNPMERSRGITIFAKQAQLTLGPWNIQLLDTPGHVDFSGEMERTLQVLDYGILVISGADGIQGHVLTLWKLLKRYNIPTFIFVNKMDQPGTSKAELMALLKKRLDDKCVDFDENQDSEIFIDALTLCHESLIETYLEKGDLTTEDIQGAIAKRQVFPCFFGSALKLHGITELIEGLEIYIQAKTYPKDFGARVFKIGRDAQGQRLTYMKVTGGSLKVKMALSGESTTGESWTEKADQLRIYSGSQFQLTDQVEAGGICCVSGLSKTYSGQGLGGEDCETVPVLEPVLTYAIQLPQGADPHKVLSQLQILEEEEPLLHILWQPELGEIHAQAMGEVQLEILKNMIEDRYGLSVAFGTGSITYKETIEEGVVGIGHYEPLRHYAEVQLLLEPLTLGSGLIFDTACSEDVLDRNWQRLILTHLEEKKHLGVLTGSEITDMKITLITGRAHQKHTEGGDFRQATYRAVRQGLKRAESVLLEPVYAFVLEVPAESIGRAQTDIQKMYGSFEPPVLEGETALLKGRVPVATARDYQREVNTYTRGRGRFGCTLAGYQPCHNAQAVIEARGYDSERDLDNPTGSVFCAHGAGFAVPWDKVKDYAHLSNGYKENDGIPQAKPVIETTVARDSWGEDKELAAIFERTYGSSKKDSAPVKSQTWGVKEVSYPKTQKSKKAYLLVDGYNIIFSWPELKALADVNIESARSKLMDILCNYQGFKKINLILVFDAYKVEGGVGEVSKYHNIYVVYTKEAETADQYIEKTVHEMGRKYQVTVATSDALEQVIILGQGGQRLSAQDLWKDIEETNAQIRETLESRQDKVSNPLFDYVPEVLEAHLEEVRLGKTVFGETNVANSKGK